MNSDIVATRKHVIWAINRENLSTGSTGACQGRSQELDLGVYVLTSHCNFKTYVNVPHVNKAVTDFGGIYTDIHIATALVRAREKKITV